MNGTVRFGKKDAVKGFGFDWVLKAGKNVEVENFYAQGQWELIFTSFTTDNGERAYNVGNPLLGGIKTFKKYGQAERYFFEMVGRVQMDALFREVA